MSGKGKRFGRMGRGRRKKDQPDSAEKMSALESLISELESLGADVDPEIQSLIQAKARQWNNGTVQRLLEKKLEPYLARKLADPDEFRRNRAAARGLLQGEIVLASTENGRWGLDKDDLRHHMLIVGRTGSGKTCLCLLLVKKIMEASK